MIQTEIRTVDISEIKPNPDNPRTITDKALDQIKSSLVEFPEMMQLREIVVDENMIILGGNMRYHGLMQLGEETAIAKIVTGLTPHQKREFIIKDNSQFGQWDMDALANQFSGEPLHEWGLEVPEAFTDPIGDHNIYTRNIEAPIYEPKDEAPPDPSTLLDDTKTKELRAEIDSSDIPGEIAEFLSAAAGRHTVFDYKLIAEYYAHAAPDIQTLMENSALVIIDFDRAIELGYVRLSEEIAAQYTEDYGDA